jgi:phosphatidylinositol alpha-1,6-mannosyltransferase
VLASFYKLADIFVMPHRQLASDVEGLGIVFLEAASFSLPIIAGFSGGVSEIFTDQRNIIFIKNDSVAELELALTSLLNNDKLALNLGQEANLLVKNFPSASEQSQELTKILS